MKSFYAFKGSWFEILDKLVGVIQPRNCERFSIWESTNKNQHLLIVYGIHLSPEWQRKYNVQTITEPDFNLQLKAKMKDHRIHGYNEFEKRRD